MRYAADTNRGQRFSPRNNARSLDQSHLSWHTPCRIRYPAQATRPPPSTGLSFPRTRPPRIPHPAGSIIDNRAFKFGGLLRWRGGRGFTNSNFPGTLGFSILPIQNLAVPGVHHVSAGNPQPGWCTGGACIRDHDRNHHGRPNPARMRYPAHATWLGNKTCLLLIRKFAGAQAGRAFAITVATNMAARGTDILLGGNAGFNPTP